MIQLKKPMKILLVEDNKINQKLMMFNFTKMGFDIAICDDGQHAVNECKSNFYDVILMDVMMPIMDGYQATEEIRKMQARSNEKSYIVGLTSNVYDHDKEHCLSVGMDSYMSKPFDIDIFCDILRQQNYL